jgi:transposase
LKNFKTAFTGNLKLETSRQYRHRRRRYRRYRRSRSIFEKKKGRCKKAEVSHGEQMMNKLRRGELPFVRRSHSRRSRRS